MNRKTIEKKSRHSGFAGASFTTSLVSSFQTLMEWSVITFMKTTFYLMINLDSELGNFEITGDKLAAHSGAPVESRESK